ncbi:ATP-binding protein [Nonomuraea sp. CA-143628]|uniref:ATP-binding protein n=1 Tax=Nonomuraea sp. CA-143628 TaxID=3239997 RepID=UPI003D8DEA60
MVGVGGWRRTTRARLNGSGRRRSDGAVSERDGVPRREVGGARGSSLRRCVAASLRRCVAAVLLGAGCQDVDNARLIISELVSNALQHTASGYGGGLVAVDVIGLGSALTRIEVTDDGADTVPRPRLSDGLASRGRGLRLVEQIAAAWGVRRSGGRQLTVWAEVRTSPGVPVCAEERVTSTVTPRDSR